MFLQNKFERPGMGTRYLSSFYLLPPPIIPTLIFHHYILSYSLKTLYIMYFLLTFAIHQTPNCIKHREQVVQHQVSSKAIPKENHQCLSLLQSFIYVWTCSTSVFIVEIIFQRSDHIFPYFHYISLYHQSFKPSHHLGSCISSASIELKIFYNYKTTNELDWR